MGVGGKFGEFCCKSQPVSFLRHPVCKVSRNTLYINTQLTGFKVIVAVGGICEGNGQFRHARQLEVITNGEVVGFWEGQHSI